MNEIYMELWYDVRGSAMSDEEADRIASAIWSSDLEHTEGA